MTVFELEKASNGLVVTDGLTEDRRADACVFQKSRLGARDQTLVSAPLTFWACIVAAGSDTRPVSITPLTKFLFELIHLLTFQVDDPSLMQRVQWQFKNGEL